MICNKVYDVSKYSHPGGQFLITKTIGKEISRYFYGNFALEDMDVKAYSHSPDYFDALST
jgi:cytochrome b involved in lipid metabolism